jgi:hypothetical protein
MLTLLNNALVLVVMLVQYVSSLSCKHTTLLWRAHSMPWRITHDPISNFETIASLPPLSKTSELTEGECDLDQIVFEC